MHIFTKSEDPDEMQRKANTEDPDEMQHIAGSILFVKVKQIFRQKDTVFLKIIF